jgi:hypothetical protein
VCVCVCVRVCDHIPAAVGKRGGTSEEAEEIPVARPLSAAPEIAHEKAVEA